MLGEPCRIFISSAILGFEEARQAVGEALADLIQEGMALSVLRSEDFPALDASPQRACLEAVQRCDLYLGIFGRRYSAPTAEEYAEARSHAKPCLIFVEEGALQEPAQEEFLVRLDGWAEGHIRRTFRTPDDLKYQVARALRNLLDSLLTRYLRPLVEELASLPLAPMEERSVATSDLVRIELLEQTKDKGEAVLRRSGLGEAIRRHPRLLIVGPGGSGKSTALRRMAFDLASGLLDTPVPGASWTSETPVPVLLRLSRYDGDLLGKVAASLSTSIGAVEASLAQERIVLFLDGFDELSLKRRFLDDLEQLVRRVPLVRYVLTSRPDPALAALSPSVAVPLSLAPLEEAELASLLAMHLGTDSAERLLHALEDRGLVEPFRLPLMAWLATLAFRGSSSESLPVAKGALFERVLDDFLRKWEARRSSDLVDRRVDLKIECLASLGQEMVRLNVTTLGMNQTLSLCQTVLASRDISAVMPDQLLEELEAQSLLSRSSRGVEFWHLGLRDHFAAVWLARHARPWKVAFLARHARWQEPVTHLASMLDESRSRDLLGLLLRLLPLAILGCSLRPVGWAADWIFLVLRCLTEAPHPCDDLKDQFLDRIKGRNFYLSGARAPVRFQQLGGPDARLEFHALIGQLGTKASFDYLRQVGDPRFRVVGLGQFRNTEAVAALLAGFEGQPRAWDVADRLAAICLLRFPSDILLESVEGFFHRAEPAARARLLDCLAYPLRDGVRLKERGRWESFVAEIALSDSDTDVRSKACSFLRSLEGHGSLPPEVERLFLEALAHEEALRRYNAIWPLVYSGTDKSREALVCVLHDEDPWTRLRALDALRIRDRKRFPDHVVTFLKGLEQDGPAESFAEAFAWLVSSFPQINPTILEKVLWLGLGTKPPLDDDIRTLAVKALGGLALSFTVPILAAIFEHDEEARVRKEALYGLVGILGGEALPYLLQGLTSPAAQVRKAAIYCCQNLTGEAAKAVLPRLRELVATEFPQMKFVADLILKASDE
jgi:hypothetical protein